MYLEHEHVLGEVINNQSSLAGKDNSVIRRYSDGIAYAGNKLFSSTGHQLEIILHHDDFNVVNPLGNKVSKYKLSAFYFVVGNISNKFRSRLKDIHLVLLCPSTLVTEYGYEKLLTPLLEDLYKLETEGLIIKFENQSFTFKGSLSMIIADNLAAHALGGFFCNFSTVQRFCRHCNFTKDQLQHPENLFDFGVRTTVGYNKNLLSVQDYPQLSATYGIKELPALVS